MRTPVEKVMTSDLLTVPTGTSLFEAHELMITRGIRHLPVKDSNGNIAGILSLKDLAGAADSVDLTVDMVMSSPVLSVHQTNSLRQAVLKMLDHHISSLLVTNDEDEPLGIVTTEDLLWFLAHEQEKEETETEAKERPFLSAMDRQTIGQVAHQLSLMGI